MPIVKLMGRLIYFSHVPKAAGSSVERYLIERGAVLALRDTRWGKRPIGRRWTSTSPQHVDGEEFRRLFPDGFFDHVFMATRHPEDRLLSEYRFRAERSLRDARAPFSEWAAYAMEAARRDPYVMDGHVRPQIDFVCGDDCAAFRIEDGFGDLVAWLDAALGASRPGPAFATARNATRPRPITLHREDRALMQSFYAADYERFGYERRPLDTLPRLSPLRLAGRGAASLAGRLPGRR